MCVYQQPPRPGTQETMALCPTCRQQTVFRAPPGGSWFCTQCGTPNDPRPVVIHQREGSRWRLRILTVLVLLGVWIAGQATAGATGKIRCTPFTTCTVTITNTGFWPLQVNATSIEVDENTALLYGQTFLWPFSTVRLDLYDAQGKPLTAAPTGQVVVDAVFGMGSTTFSWPPSSP